MSEFHEFTSVALRPDDIPAGEKQECVSNSLDIAVEFGLDYAEGIALGHVGVWVRHAWNVDEEGQVIDTTWDEPSTRYIGRVIPAEDKVRSVLDAGIYHFENQGPFVPDGEVGLDCYTREQFDWIQGQMSGGRRGHERTRRQ